MFLELVGAFRCPRPHELTWLVALAHELEDRDIIDGELGCPTCGARYAVVRGVADFRSAGDAQPAAPDPDREGGRAAAPDAAAMSELAVRAAALLGLAEPGGVAVLTGAWAVAAHDVVALTENVNVLAIDPPRSARVPQAMASGGGVSIALAPDTLPLRPLTVRAIALDAAHAVPAFLESSVDALRPHGRLVAPATTPLPQGISELARDDLHWVGEKIQRVRLERTRPPAPPTPYS